MGKIIGLKNKKKLEDDEIKAIMKARAELKEQEKSMLNMYAQVLHEALAKGWDKTNTRYYNMARMQLRQRIIAAYPKMPEMQAIIESSINILAKYEQPFIQSKEEAEKMKKKMKELEKESEKK